MTVSQNSDVDSALPAEPTGMWLVSTQTSSYLLDFTAGTATRYSGTLAVPAMADDVAELRRDRDAINLRSVQAAVGARCCCCSTCGATASRRCV